MKRLLAALTAAIALACGPFAPARGVLADQASDQLATAQAEQKLIDLVRAKLGNDLADALAAQGELDTSLQQNREQQQKVADQISASDAKILGLDSDISHLEAAVATTQATIDEENRQLTLVARVLYAQPDSTLVVMAESDGLGDFLTRLADLRSAAERARALKESLNRDEQRLRDERAKTGSDRAQEVTVRSSLQTDQASLQDLQAKQERSKNDLAAKIDQTKAEVDAAAQQSAQLASQITDLLVQQQDEIIAAAMQQVWHQVKLQSGKVTDGSLNVSQGHSQDTRLIWPEKNAVVTQGFGPSSLKLEPPFEGFPHFHSGVDMALPLGTPVVAADDGVVLLVGQDPLGYGTYIVLGHRDGLTTLYGHLSAAEVKAMDQVIQGQPIGLEGSTGNSTGPHLHFELRVGGDPVDPALYLPPPYVAAPG